MAGASPGTMHGKAASCAPSSHRNSYIRATVSPAAKSRGSKAAEEASIVERTSNAFS